MDTTFTAFGRRYITSVFVVGCKIPVESSQVYSRLQYQCCQPGNKTHFREANPAPEYLSAINQQTLEETVARFQY